MSKCLRIHEPLTFAQRQLSCCVVEVEACEPQKLRSLEVALRRPYWKDACGSRAPLVLERVIPIERLVVVRALSFARVFLEAPIIVRWHWSGCYGWDQGWC